eukprot:1594347-Pleurochrysis_carterae.AAC.1
MSPVGTRRGFPIRPPDPLRLMSPLVPFPSRRLSAFRTRVGRASPHMLRAGSARALHMFRM